MVVLLLMLIFIPNCTRVEIACVIYCAVPCCWCSIFNCGMWWSAVHCTISYPNMQVSALHHRLWPFFTADPHPRVHVHRPTVVCSSHNCVGLQGIPLNMSLISPHNRFTYSPSQSACAQTNSCLWLTQPCLAAGNPLTRP